MSLLDSDDPEVFFSMEQNMSVEPAVTKHDAASSLATEIPVATITPILLSARDAAKLLALSERTLWGLTAPRGPIPAARIGRSVRYRHSDLETFAAQAAQKNGQA